MSASAPTSPNQSHAPQQQQQQSALPAYVTGANNYANQQPNFAPPNYSDVNGQMRSSAPPQSMYGFSSSLPTPAPQTGSAKQQVSDSAMREGFNIQYNELTFEKKIGAGAFGEVWKGEWAGTNVAIKKILKADISEADLKEFSTEILLVSKLRHPNIVQFLGACMDPDFCLVIEFMDRGTLFDVVQQNSLTWKLKASMITDIVKGMMYLHTRTPPIVHRDVKSLNILVIINFFIFVLYFNILLLFLGF